jgi:hypothetical protein
MKKNEVALFNLPPPHATRILAFDLRAHAAAPPPLFTRVTLHRWHNVTDPNRDGGVKVRIVRDGEAFQCPGEFATVTRNPPPLLSCWGHPRLSLVVAPPSRLGLMAAQ